MSVRLPRFNRRKLIRWGGATVAVGAAGIGGAGYYAGYLRGSLFRSGEGEDVVLPDRRIAVPKGSPVMTVARGRSPARNVAAALDAIGGIEQFVEQGDVVAIKANVGFNHSHYYATTTNTEVLSAVIHACRDAGAKQVIVSDCPAVVADMTFTTTGIRKASLEAGAKVMLPQDDHFVRSVLPTFGSWPVFRVFAEADKLINVPVVKHHGLAKTTTGMKNWFGSLGGRRFKLHPRIDDAVAELAGLFRPTLTVVDAVRILMRNGPRGGNLDDVKQVDAVAVSVDPVAVDAWSAGLLGVDPSTLGWLEKGQAKGLGKIDYRAAGMREVRTG